RIGRIEQGARKTAHLGRTQGIPVAALAYLGQIAPRARHAVRSEDHHAGQRLRADIRRDDLHVCLIFFLHRTSPERDSAPVPLYAIACYPMFPCAPARATVMTFKACALIRGMSRRDGPTQHPQPRKEDNACPHRPLSAWKTGTACNRKWRACASW